MKEVETLTLEEIQAKLRAISGAPYPLEGARRHIAEPFGVVWTV
jgi:hypothetical protein